MSYHKVLLTELIIISTLTYYISGYITMNCDKKIVLIFFSYYRI